MRKCLLKGISLALALVLVLTVLPALAPKAEAAEEQGVVVYEDDFSNYNSLEEFQAKYTLGTATYVTKSFSEEGLVFTIGSKVTSTANKNISFKINDEALNIPATDGTTSLLKFELIASNSAGKSVFFYIGSETYVKANGIEKAFKVPSGSSFFNITTGYGYAYYNGVINSYETRISLRSTLAGEVTTIKGIKISVVPVEDNDISTKTDILDSLKAVNGYAKLLSDVTLTTGFTMGDNAVLDLNGHTLTVAAGQTLTGGINTRIVDTSAGKTGKIVCDEGALVLTNPNHPTLPLYTGDGYIFTEPKLEETSQYQIINASADGFTLQFRPGFGEFDGANIRATYLKAGTSGIKMNVDLAWTDMFGNTNSTSQSLNADWMFNQMYAQENLCGQIDLTGAQEFTNITVTISLESCGVTKVLAPITFDNTFVTVLHASEEPLVPTTNTSWWEFEALPSAAADKMLVFDVMYENTNPEAFEAFALAFRDGSAYYAFFNSRNVANTNKELRVANILNQGDKLENGHIRYVVDLKNGDCRLILPDGSVHVATYGADDLAHIYGDTRIYFYANEGLDAAKYGPGGEGVCAAYSDNKLSNVKIYTVDYTAG